MPDPPAVFESIVGNVPAELAGFRCILGNGGGEAARIRVFGELDLATSRQLRDALPEGAPHARRMVLDQRELTFLDTSGVHVIGDASDRARQSGGRLVRVRGPSQVDRLFALPIQQLPSKCSTSRPPVQAFVQVASSAAA
jgi:anti-anti-sigma factor